MLWFSGRVQIRCSHKTNTLNDAQASSDKERLLADMKIKSFLLQQHERIKSKLKRRLQVLNGRGNSGGEAKFEAGLVRLAKTKNIATIVAHLTWQQFCGLRLLFLSSPTRIALEVFH